MFVGSVSLTPTFQGNGHKRKKIKEGLKSLVNHKSPDRLEINKPASGNTPASQLVIPQQNSSNTGTKIKPSQAETATERKGVDASSLSSSNTIIKGHKPPLSENTQGKLPDTDNGKSTKPIERTLSFYRASAISSSEYWENRAKKELVAVREFFNTQPGTRTSELVKAMEAGNITPHKMLETLNTEQRKELMKILSKSRSADWLDSDCQIRKNAHSCLNEVDRNFLNSLPDYIIHSTRKADSFENPDAWANGTKVAINHEGVIVFPEFKDKAKAT